MDVPFKALWQSNTICSSVTCDSESHILKFWSDWWSGITPSSKVTNTLLDRLNVKSRDGGRRLVTSGIQVMLEAETDEQLHTRAQGEPGPPWPDYETMAFARYEPSKLTQTFKHHTSLFLKNFYNTHLETHPQNPMWVWFIEEITWYAMMCHMCK